MNPAVRVTLVGALLVLEACGGNQTIAPVSSRTARNAPAADQTTLGRHTVESGETLYSIAWQYGFDYKTLARWNRIAQPYRIYQGQRLTLIPPASAPEKFTSQPAPAQRKPDTAPGKPAAEQKSALSADDADTAPAPANLVWIWPANGELLAIFTSGETKGVNIAGREGAPVSAASSGRVVYSGSGLVGLGELIIIKHNATFLSAYAHNKLRMVQEGDTVKAGQAIAQMGRSGTDRVMLHFEVRKDGKPVDPMQYLPKRR